MLWEKLFFTCGTDSLKAEGSDTGMTPNSELEPNPRGQMACAVGAISYKNTYIYQRSIRAKLFCVVHEDKCHEDKPYGIVRNSATA